MAPTQLSGSSNLLLRKRTSDAARRRSGQLGAVKRITEAEIQTPGRFHFTNSFMHQVSGKPKSGRAFLCSW